MEAMEYGEAVSAGAGWGQGSSAPAALTDNPQAMLTVVVEVKRGRESGRWEQGGSPQAPGAQGAECFQSPLLRPGCACVPLQEAEEELLARVQRTLGSVGQGYNVALLLWGWETEAPRLVPQLLQMLFEEALPLGSSDPVLSTLNLVQREDSGPASPGTENLSVLDVAPLGLVVEDAHEVKVSDSRAASELYLRATVDCPLLQVLAGKVVEEEVEGSLPWIVSWLLEGSNYTSILLRLDPQGSSLSLFRAALLGAARRRMQVKQVKPTLWDAAEEAQARRAGLKSLRSGLLGDPLTDGGLSQLGRAPRELQVVKAWSRHPGSRMLTGVKAEAVVLPEPQVYLFIRHLRSHTDVCLPSFPLFT
ncbi:hypothetical protein QTO34_016148 [Cnephaeus nilssonii]|uniref:Uncharacterized protein n=1 Tax=Cnephaeus nilssonii TaxID=3371016 RepID=A0AA40I5E6_CNENI|nr:hypothetical protein QTO34_016148 [Eptesicus nilssonii]